MRKTPLESMFAIFEGSKNLESRFAIFEGNKNKIISTTGVGCERWYVVKEKAV